MLGGEDQSRGEMQMTNQRLGLRFFRPIRTIQRVHSWKLRLIVVFLMQTLPKWVKFQTFEP